MLERNGGLKESGPPEGSSTIRRCDFVRVGVALLEDVYHYGGGL